MRAVQYLRMSTQRQNYSLQYQLDAIAAYASRHSFEIVRTYTDAARSGLSLSNRPGLSRLLSEVQTGQADFEAILVYDVSRFGRFQDADESAHYDFICHKAGVRIHYCAEPFSGQGLEPSLLKSMKRAMAAEYSRELSVKTTEGHRRLVQNRFRPGAHAPFGLRRLLVGTDGVPKRLLENGEQKNLKTEKVTLTLGPQKEVEAIRRIFRLFVDEGRTRAQIVRLLRSDECIAKPPGGWQFCRLTKVLTNESYIGNIVYRKSTRKLGDRLIRNPESSWIRSEAAFPSIIDRECFLIAAQIIAAKSRPRSNEDMLRSLSQLHRRIGRLTCAAIDDAPGVPCAASFAKRFGSLARAFELIGHPPPTDLGMRHSELYREMHNHLVTQVVDLCNSAGILVQRTKPLSDGILQLDQLLSLKVAIAPARRDKSARSRWRIRVHAVRTFDLLLAARASRENGILDFYLVPIAALDGKSISLGPSRTARHECFRIPDPRIVLTLLRALKAGGQMPRSVLQFASLLGSEL